MMINKKVLNYGLLVCGAAACLTGVMMQIGYHIGVADRAAVVHKQVWGLNYAQWQASHEITATLFFVLSLIHIYKHRKWYKGVIERRVFKRNRELLLFSVLFCLSAILGFLPWLISCKDEQLLRHTLIEIHDKISIVLLIFIVLHIVKRWRCFHKSNRKR